MTFGYIYKIQFPNGKNYIGLTTTSLEQRTKEHKRSAERGDLKLIYKALRKYEMIDSFELIEIDTATTLEELREKEIGYILEYKSHYIDGNGYNMTYGGEGTNGYVFTEDDNKKNSDRKKKYYENPEAIQKNREAIKKYYEDNPIARQKMSEIKNKYYQDNPEARQKVSDASKKYYAENPEARQKVGETSKKYYAENPEAGKQHSEKMKKHYEENPEAGKRHSEIMKKHYENPEAREQMSTKIKTYYEDNPEARSELCKKMKKRYEDNPEMGKEQSERIKKYYEDNPEAMRKILDRRGQNKPFEIFTIDGTFIKTFNYQFEAKEYLQKEHNITSTIKIWDVLVGKRNNSAGFVFKYKII